ncbi:MAG: hypothetical protein ABIV06_04530 [Thermoanaerobaculia bacterium]
MIRSILSVIVGILAGVVTIFLLEMAGHRFYPPPAGLDPGNVEAFKAAVAAAPVGMLLSVILAWAGGAFIGGGVAALLSERRRALHSLAVGGIQTLLAVAQLQMIPHPLWFTVLGVTIFLPVAALAGHIVGREPDLA